MFIKNNIFYDEDTLLEAMFDFNIGNVSPYIKAEIEKIDNDLKANDAYQQYVATLSDEDDRAELYIEERDLRLAEVLMNRFEQFVIERAKLFGVKDGKRTLLYEIDMV